MTNEQNKMDDLSSSSLSSPLTEKNAVHNRADKPPTSASSQDDDDSTDATQSEDLASSSSSFNNITAALKLTAAAALLYFSVDTFRASSSSLPMGSEDSVNNISEGRRRLSSENGVPTYMKPLMDELVERKKLMEETPPEEVKYWFEYTGPLQKYYYRWSKTRGKADSFEGRDDSGVVSSRFIDRTGGGEEYRDFFFPADDYPEDEIMARTRLLDNCLSMGSKNRPNTEKGTIWNDWFGVGSSAKKTAGDKDTLDRCRILFTLNTVGAGRGPTMLWETKPPKLHAEEPKPWISEQETAATHLERSLREIDTMCATGQIAARVQVLVCEPIPGEWTDWMDSLLVSCGGKDAPPGETPSKNPYDSGIKVEERPSPVQVVVIASAASADTCHDLKSGFAEKRMQDLILAPPYISADAKKGTKDNNRNSENVDPTIKTTHPDLVSSDDHDLYVALKWSSLVTLRAISSFLQASADIAAAAYSKNNQEPTPTEKDADGVTVALNTSPSSPFLIPSFVRVSYVSEENNKVAKWRMHGDFFHPAAWEVCKDSFDLVWIPDSLSGSGGVNVICDDDSKKNKDCGQWWVYMAEEQMPTNPEVFANEVTPTLIQGGSNFIWMITERQRQEIVKQKYCEHEFKDDLSVKKKCGESPQAVLPLGDLESFLINFTPNTALGKKHNKGRGPGYSRAEERERERDLVRERKQLKGQEDIEKALFDYTVYAAALFKKDATIKAARLRDALLTKKADIQENVVGPQTVKSSYYDVTITKPREATLAWCQSISRKGLCVLYADYFREALDGLQCSEACGMQKNWTKIRAN